jgi:hypothetical protein
MTSDATTHHHDFATILEHEQDDKPNSSSSFTLAKTTK